MRSDAVTKRITAAIAHDAAAIIPRHRSWSVEDSQFH
jgi:hypothetical protein